LAAIQITDPDHDTNFGPLITGILPGAKFTLHPSLAFSYTGSVTAWHSSSRRQPNFVAWDKEWNYELLLLVLYIPGSENPLMKFHQLENSLQM